MDERRDCFIEKTIKTILAKYVSSLVEVSHMKLQLSQLQSQD